MRWMVTLTVLVWTAAASAAPLACMRDIAGPWSGLVFDEGRLKDLHTNFSIAGGDLTGRYHVDDEDGGYDGQLTDFTATGPCAGTFIWHDRNGAGVVHVDFRPERDRFDGEWGGDRPLPGYIFTGRRVRRVPVS
jgi:hypothetical protein